MLISNELGHESNKRSKGFGTVEALLTMVIVGLIVGVGYYVSQKPQAPKAQKSTTSNTKPVLTSFTDPTKLYSFQYPKGWTIEELPTIDGAVHSIAISYPGAPAESYAVLVSADKTPKQAETARQWEESAKREPKLYSTTTINGYKAMHRHIAYDDEEGSAIEDTYLLVNDDQSSVMYLIESKSTSKDPELADDNYDATSRLKDFKAIVYSTKFIR